MKKNKGCPNEECEAHQKKLRFKSDVKNCPMCGKELVYVCMKCYTQLDDDSKKLCVMCDSKRKEKKEKAVKAGKGIITGAIGLFCMYAASNKDDISEEVGSFIEKFNDKG